MTKVLTDLDPATPEERRAFEKDGGWVRVASLAADKYHSPRDWRTAVRALRIYLRAMQLQGAGGAMAADEARAWFSSWHVMLDLRRLIAAADRAELPEGDEP